MRAARRRSLGTLGAAALAAAGVGRPVRAQEDRAPISILMGFGVGMDYTARLVAEQMRESLGRPVVPMARLGAGGRVMLAELRRAQPDGRTLGFSTSSPFAIYPHIYSKLDYDPVADFTPIAGVAWFDVGIAAAPQTGITDMNSLVAWGRSRPNGDVLYGCSPGTGSSPHFLGIAIGLSSGLKMTLVPYKETQQGVTDLVTGRIPLLITGSSAMTEMHRAGTLKIIATSGDRRAPLTPAVPTLKESGMDLSFVARAGLFGPARMAPELVERLQASFLPALSRPDIRERLAGQGMVAQPMTGAQMAEFLAAERDRFAGLAKASGYVPEPA